MAFLAKVGPQSFLVEGCLGQLATRTEMWVHFLYQHFLDTVVILEELIFPHPCCIQYEIFLPGRALNDNHPATAQCARVSEQKRRRIVEAELRESSERAFKTYREPLENVTAFRYLGRMLMAGYDD